MSSRAATMERLLAMVPHTKTSSHLISFLKSTLMPPGLHFYPRAEPMPRMAPAKDRRPSSLTNQPEPKSFMAAALAWQGSVTPIVLPRVLCAAFYAVIVCGILSYAPQFHVPITPFEYSGAVLALILVLRVNAGHDRWWEARKLWGNIVNQSRNLAVVVSSYGSSNKLLVDHMIKLIALWPHVMRESLRGERNLTRVERIAGSATTEAIVGSQHMPLYVGSMIAKGLHELSKQGMNAMAFLRAESERSQLLDAIGACERILNTRMPLALVIKTRRFLLLFLMLLPFALAERVEYFTPLIVALASYPLFSLDEIGAQLQNPFSRHNLSHLPLDTICDTIADNVLALSMQEPTQSNYLSWK